MELGNWNEKLRLLEAIQRPLRLEIPYELRYYRVVRPRFYEVIRAS